MLVNECMTKKVSLGTPEMSLFEVAVLMRNGGFGILPIAENDRLVGVITDRDITVRAVADGFNPTQVPAREIMSKKVLYCYDDHNLETVAENFEKNSVRRLPVLNRQKKLVGIISLSDLPKIHSPEIQSPKIESSKTSSFDTKNVPYNSLDSMEQNFESKTLPAEFVPVMT